MELYSNNEYYKLYKGNMLDLGEVIKPCSIDAVLTDPPYELNFMGKGWDNSGIAFQPDTWKKCLEALKPGGYLLAFGGSRTYHRIACAIEDAGFEIRDCIMWLYGSGFPKSMALDKSIEGKLTTGSANKTEFKKLNGEKIDRGNYGYAKMQNEQGNRPADYNKIEESRLGALEATTELAKQWKGWGTALKPSYEPIIVARKPLEGSCTDNVIKYGVGGINIDECRVGFDSEEDIRNYENNNDANLRTTKSEGENLGAYEGGRKVQKDKREVPQGRFPANTILTYDDSDFEEVCGGFPNTKSGSKLVRNYEVNRKGLTEDNPVFNTKTSGFRTDIKNDAISNYGDSGSASRYFYCAKASKRDRDEGLDEFEEAKTTDGCIRSNEETVRKFGANSALRRNIHPTVKPCDLMQYLVRLVTPNGGTVLDPFNGSGSTGKAVMYENKDRNKNYKYIGIELTEEYLPIAKARIEYVINKGTEKEKSDPKQEDQNKERKESALF